MYHRHTRDTFCETPTAVAFVIVKHHARARQIKHLSFQPCSYALVRRYGKGERDLHCCCIPAWAETTNLRQTMLIIFFILQIMPCLHQKSLRASAVCRVTMTPFPIEGGGTLGSLRTRRRTSP